MRVFSGFTLGMAAAALLLARPGAGLANDGATVAGAAVFAKYCAECHAPPTLNQNKVGPSLHGVVGRHAGRAPGYGYSTANINSNIVWTEQELDLYLANPKATVPPRAYHPRAPATGTNMLFQGLKDAAERHAVIAYLKAN